MALREGELCECFADARGAPGDFGLLEIGQRLKEGYLRALLNQTAEDGSW